MVPLSMCIFLSISNSLPLLWMCADAGDRALTCFKNMKDRVIDFRCTVVCAEVRKGQRILFNKHTMRRAEYGFVLFVAASHVLGF